ncbi:MAG: hypothetical protein RLY78_2708 [Pseudomonadota bacterium]
MSDHTAHAPTDVLVIASWNADLVCRVPRPLARGETLAAHAFEISPGGKGSNAAVAAARQGAHTAVLARIGDDDFGRMALQLWTDEGIDHRLVEIAAGERSGIAQILVYDDGDNSIAVAAGAGLGLGARQVQAAAGPLAACRVLLASNEVPAAATETAFAAARALPAASRPLTVLNPAPARALPDTLLAACDLLTPNESEVRVLAGLGEDAPVEQAAQRLLDRGCAAVVVTLGADGCLLLRPDRPPRHWAGHRVPAVVDTVGAGDTFNGALCAALARGQALEDALTLANAAASLSVQGRGALGGMPDRPTTERWLHSTSAA